MCKQLAKGCTRQHGSRDSNLRPADCKLSSLTTWSPSHTLVNHINKIQTGLLTEQESGTDGTGDICGYCGLRPAASDKMCRHRRGWEILWNLAEASTTFGFCLTRDHSRLGQVAQNLQKVSQRPLWIAGARISPARCASCHLCPSTEGRMTVKK